MAVRIEAGSEPIPGYKLMERLGGGGFGEVWKAEAPGGLFKAIKFVYGDLQAADSDEGARAEQELKAMSRVKTVHHPYILSLERFDIIDGQLIIVMELADRTLWDRYKEARSQGNPGIPREELLGYIQETAEALDLMNIQFQLQHLDIKPQNLFLVFNHIKVADFGLVKDLGAMGAATMTGGVTPVYAAPETFDGWLSRFSDQYSLAIVYQELLTGQRPFAGNTMRQLVLQHLQGSPDVSSLPVAERPVISRALSKNPDERYPTCVDLVRALKAAAAPPPVAPVPTPAKPETGSTLDSDFFKSAPPQTVNELDKTWAPRRSLPKPVTMPIDVPNTSFGQVTPSNIERSLPKSGSKLPPRPGKAPKKEPEKPAPQPDDSALRGVIQPALVMGLGNFGVQTLHQLRRVLCEEFGHSDAVPHIRFLGINTDGETVRESVVGEMRSALRPHEYVLARLHRANQYVGKARGDGKLPTDSWLNPKIFYRITKETAKAPVRPLGRLAFVTNLAHISKRIEAELQACCSQETLHETSRFTDIGVRSLTPRVYIVASLSGSTGSGMFIDAAYVVRSHLRQMGLEAAEVVGLFFLPPVGREGREGARSGAARPDGARSMALANAHAALAELNYFTQHAGMRARYDNFDAREPIHFSESGPPFQRCIFSTLVEARSPSDAALIPEAVLEAGQFLYRDLATGLGKGLDKLRQKRLENIRLPGATGGAIHESFGLYRLGWPKRDVQNRLAERFCVRLIERWKTKKAAHLTEEIDEWVVQQWESLEMRPENLIARHQEECQRALNTTPDKIFQGIQAPLVKALAATGKATPDIGPVIATMEQYEKLLGIPDLCRDASHRNIEPGSLERTLMEVSAGIADQCDQKLAELVVGLIEAPRYRLAGAEDALRRFNSVTENALKAQETLAKELHERSAALYSRIQQHIAKSDKTLDGHSTGAPSGSQWFGRGKGATAATDLIELLRVYPKTQFQALLLQCLNRLYISIRGHLSDQLREVGFCRQRLDELAGLVQTKSANAAPQQVEFEKNLLPIGCKRVGDVVARLEEQLTDDDVLAFDEVVQTHVRKQYKAFLNVCLGASGMVRALAPVLVQEAAGYLDQRFPPPSVVDLLRAGDNPETPSNLEDSVRGMFEEAAPEVKRADEDRQYAVVALPNDEAGQPLTAAVGAALPRTHIVPSDRCDEIVFVREQILNGIGDLEQMGSVAREAYRQRLAQDPSALHSREDIPDWNPHGAPV
jgi:serine/threonine protein kinase